MKELEFAWCVDLAGRVYRFAGFFADFAGARFEDNVWPCFAEDHPEDGDKGCVVDDLDVENPAGVVRSLLDV